jgi:putative hydrolase of the HAD superfamily
MVEAVIFDLGGTLIEYAGKYDRWPDLETPGLTAAYDYLKHQGIELTDFAYFQATGFALLPGRWRQAVEGEQNLQLVELLAEVLQVCGQPCDEPSWLVEAAEHYQAAVRAQAEAMPYARETLADLKTEGYKLGLISNTMFTGEAHREDLKRFGLADYFDVMLFSADVNKWKPNPEPFLHVLEILAVPPAAAVFVGDDPAADIVGGRRAGMRTVHYKSSQRFRPPDGVTPHAEICSLEELLPLLKQWQGK